MNITRKIKGRLSLFLIAAIIILCVGFLIISCGSGPALKDADSFRGKYALDFTDCPDEANDTCIVAFESESFALEKYNIQNKPLSMSAWIKPKATSTGTVFKRGSNSRGISLDVTGTSATQVIPSFTIRRTIIPVDEEETSTVSYTVSGTAINAGDDADWVHIAGVLYESQSGVDHSTVHTDAGVSCAGAGSDTDATDDQWHLDFYIDGVLVACAASYGDTAASGGEDSTGASTAYAHNPEGHTAAPGKFMGIIDEARIWTVARTAEQLLACKDRELGKSAGTCTRNTDSLIMYLRFNEGRGHGINDFAGLGSGAKEWVAGDNVFPAWDEGWTTDTPIQTTAD